MSAEQLFKRNLNWAYGVKYDLQQVHSQAVIQMLNHTADRLLIDEQLLSVGLRALAAHHEDLGRVVIGNSPERSKLIVEFTLLIGNVGAGKSTLINSLIEISEKKRFFECGRPMSSNEKTNKTAYRHGTAQEFTGPGIFKALRQSPNLFILVDEFDGNQNQSAIFPSHTKNHSGGSNQNSILKSLHSGLTSFQQAKVSDTECVKDAHLCFLAASNGTPIFNIIKYKLKHSQIPDPMVMRTVFDAIKTSPKFNSTRANKSLSTTAVGWEFFVLASSLLTNQSYMFEEQAPMSANAIILNHMDTIISAADFWNDRDPWIAAKFSKTSELVARLSAQLAHIDHTMTLLEEFIHEKKIIECQSPVSYEKYRELKQFIHARCLSLGGVITINERQVTAAIYVSNRIFLKFLNLFDVDRNRATPHEKVPFAPGQEEVATKELTKISQHSEPEANVENDNDELHLKQLIMTFQSVAFTRTMLYQTRKIKSNAASLDKIMNSLVNSNLLHKFERGILAASTRTDLYVKCLPSSLAPDTVNEWVNSNLDQVKLSWSSYAASCSTLTFPSATAQFSEHVNALLLTGSYKELIKENRRLSRPTTNARQPRRLEDSCIIPSEGDAVRRQDSDLSTDVSAIPCYLPSSSSECADATCDALDLSTQSSLSTETASGTPDLRLPSLTSIYASSDPLDLRLPPPAPTDAASGTLDLPSPSPTPIDASLTHISPQLSATSNSKLQSPGTARQNDISPETCAHSTNKRGHDDDLANDSTTNAQSDDTDNSTRISDHSKKINFGEQCPRSSARLAKKPRRFY